MRGNKRKKTLDVSIFNAAYVSCKRKFQESNTVKVFEVEPNQKESKRVTPAMGAISEGDQDFEACLAVFPPGRKTTLHTHTSDQLLYIIAGKGVVGTETEQHLATPGKVFVTPKGQKHFQAAMEDCSLTFLFVLRHPNVTKMSDIYVPLTVA